MRITGEYTGVILGVDGAITAELADEIHSKLQQIFPGPVIFAVVDNAASSVAFRVTLPDGAVVITPTRPRRRTSPGPSTRWEADEP